MKLHVLQGPALSGKTRHLIEEMENAHREDPISYTFLGPSAEFVGEFAERFARMVAGSVPSGNFLTLGGLATDLHRFAHPDQIYANQEAAGLMVAEALRTLDEKDLGPFAPLQDAPSLAGFVAEAVRDLKLRGRAATSKRLISEAVTSGLVSKVLKELEKSYGQKFFDASDPYTQTDPTLMDDHVRSRFGRLIFIDGLANLSKSQMGFLGKLIPLFEEGYITLDAVLWDPDNWTEFTRQLERAGVKLAYQDCNPKDENLSRGLASFLQYDFAEGSDLSHILSLAKYQNPQEETLGVCRQVKRLIQDENLRPRDISIVLNNFSERAEEFRRALEDYGVPVVGGDEKSLSNARIVQLVMLPFRAALFGYPPEVLLTLLDFPAEENKIPPQALNRLAASSGLLLGPPRSSLDSRKKEWKAKLEGQLSALKRKRQLLSEDETVLELEIVALDEEMELCNRLKRGAEEVFRSLENVEKARLEKKPKSASKEFRRWAEHWEEKSKIQGLEEESFTLQRFREVLVRLELVMEAFKRSDVRWSLTRFVESLDLLLAQEPCSPSSTRPDAVEILPLSKSQFRHREVKFMVNFNDGIFPEKITNPLYRLEEFASEERGSSNYYQQKAWEQRSHLRSAICTSERTVITYPLASNEGEPLVPSIWLDKIGGVEPQEASPIRDEDDPMSPKELKEWYGGALSRGEWINVPLEFCCLKDPLDLWREVPKFSWQADPDVVERLVGRNFSYTKLQEFKSCPFRFYLRRVMGLNEPELPSYDLSPLEQGLAYHTILKSLYDKAQSQNLALTEVVEEDSIRSEVERIMDRFASDQKIRTRKPIRKKMVSALASDVQDYLEFEVSNPEKACLGKRTLTELPFSLELCNMKEFLPLCEEKYGHLILRGRIDRVDLDIREKKGHLAVALSDYKSSTAGDWDQLKIYSLALLALDHPEVSKRPESMRAFFRTVRKPGISRILLVDAEEKRMVQQRSRPKQEPSFSDVDRYLLATLDGIFEIGEFKRCDMLEGSENSCYWCPFKMGPCLMTRTDCEGGSL